MREALLILPRYILFLFLILLVITAFTIIVMVAFGTWSFEALPHVVESALLPGVIGALFVSFFYIPAVHGIRLTAILQLVVFSSATLFFGLILTNELSDVSPDREIEFPFRDREIYIVDSGIIFTSTVAKDDRTVDGLVSLSYRSSLPVTVETDRSAPLDMTYLPTATYVPESDLFKAGTETIAIVPEDPVISPLVASPQFLASIAGQIRNICEYLSALRIHDLYAYLIACIGLCAFTASCMFFTSLSRWRLVSFLVTVLMFRAVFLVFDLATGDLVHGIFAGIDHDLLSRHLSALLLLVLAVLFIAMDQLFLRKTRSR